MGASALIFYVMMPCKGHKNVFPTLGTTVFLIFVASQCREQPFLVFLRVPNIGNSCFFYFWAFPASGTMIFVIFSCFRPREQRF